MHKIRSDGKDYYSDSILHVKKAANGCFAPCAEKDSTHIVGKVLTDNGVEDVVFEGAEVEQFCGGESLAKSKTDAEELLTIIGETVETEFQHDLEVINNV